MPLGAHKVALFGVAGVSTGSAVLLETAVASDDTSIEFTLPTDYKQVTFKIINMAPAASSYPQFQVSTGGSFDTTVTSTAFNAYHYSTGSVSGMNYRPSESQAQGTNYQDFGGYIGSQSERCGCIALTLANPSSDTFVKHWWARSSSMNADGTPYALQDHIAGYWNTSSPLTSISFICSDGNISSGTIKMWGIK